MTAALILLAAIAGGVIGWLWGLSRRCDQIAREPALRRYVAVLIAEEDRHNR